MNELMKGCNNHGETNLVRVEDQIQFTNIFKNVIKRFDKNMDKVKDSQLGLRTVYNEYKVKRGIHTIHELRAGPASWSSPQRAPLVTTSTGRGQGRFPTTHHVAGPGHLDPGLGHAPSPRVFRSGGIARMLFFTDRGRTTLRCPPRPRKGGFESRGEECECIEPTRQVSSIQA